MGGARYDLALARRAGRDAITVLRRSGGEASPALRLTMAPSYPFDARVRAVRVDGRSARFDLKSLGDRQRAEVVVEAAGPRTEVVVEYDPGTDAYVRAELPSPGARSEGLRILRSKAEPGALRLVLEGLGGRTYAFRVRSPKV